MRQLRMSAGTGGLAAAALGVVITLVVIAIGATVGALSAAYPPARPG